MKSDLNKIFNESTCLSHSEMTDYLSANLSDEKMRRVEMHIADCVMCADELEGLSNMQTPEKLQTYIDQINQEINKITANTENKFIISRTAKTRRILAVAASVLLIMAGAFTVHQFYRNSSENLADMGISENISEKKEFLSSENEESADISVLTDSDDIRMNSSRERNTESETESDYLESVEISVDASGEVVSDEISEVVESEVKAENNNFVFDDAAEESIDILSEDRKKERDIKKEVTNVPDKEVKAKQNEDDTFIGFSTRHVTVNEKEDKDKSTQFKSIRSSAMLSYDEKVYTEANQGFNEYLKYNSKDYEVIYKNGVSCYFLKDYNSALSNFDKILSPGNNKYAEDAEWYKSQTLLKLDRTDEAVNLLKNIVSKNGKYKSKAKDVLMQLD